jgi:ribonuclease Z
MVAISFRGALGILLVAALILPGKNQAQEIKVTLLGTGCPPPVMNRFGPSILVEAGKQKFLFDAGRGALQRLTQLKVQWQAVDGVFFTHLHSDHIVGFPDLWLTGWIVVPERNRALRVWGPRGTKEMVAHLEQAYRFDITMRQDDDRTSPDGVTVNAEDISEGFVLEKDGVKITAFEVDHWPIEPAFGYRIDFNGRSVVLSGDTRPSENLIRHAEGVDVLIHEVVAPDLVQRYGMRSERAAKVIAHHTTPEQAGTVFSRSKVRLAVYSHIVPPAATEQDLIPPTRKTYAGPLEVGEDLMVIQVGEKITVLKPTPSSR